MIGVRWLACKKELIVSTWKCQEMDADERTAGEVSLALTIILKLVSSR